MKRFWISGLCILLGIAAASVLYLALPVEYVSHATLYINHTHTFDRFLPGVPDIDARKVVQVGQHAALNRARVQTLVDAYDLFPSDRQERPMEDVIRTFRRHVKIEELAADRIDISFAYSDPAKAQQVVSEISTAFIEDALRQTVGSNNATLHLLEDSMQRAGLDYRKAEDAARSGGADVVRTADREFARRQYLDARTRLAEAKLVSNLSDRHLTPFLEILDGSTLPTQPETRHPVAIGGALAGGLVLAIVFQLRLGRRPDHLKPEAA